MSYTIEFIDVTSISSHEKEEIAHLYKVYFEEIGLFFDRSLDADFVNPKKYYHSTSRGAYCLLRYTPSSSSTSTSENNNNNKKIVGCVAVRDMSNAGNSLLGTNCCEIKRFFILKEHRGGGRGRRLNTAIMKKALQLGFMRIVLDTKRKLSAANALYEKVFGFVECGDYNGNRRADKWMKCDVLPPFKFLFSKI